MRRGRWARPAAVHGTWLAVRLGLSAHQVTLAALATGLLAAGAIGGGTRAGFVAGALLNLLAFWLDRVDGQVARWRGTAGLDGVYLDYLMHHAHALVLDQLRPDDRRVLDLGCGVGTAALYLADRRPVEVVGVPTVREDDGLALSSRNRYLDPEQRAAAATISAALRAGAAAGAQGAEAVLAAARAVLNTRPELLQDYLELTDTDLGPAPVAGPARLLVAARAGSTRLLDNDEVTLGETR